MAAFIQAAHFMRTVMDVTLPPEAVYVISNDAYRQAADTPEG